MFRKRQDLHLPENTRQLNDNIARVTYDNEIKSCHSRGEDINAPCEMMERYAHQGIMETPEWDQKTLDYLAEEDNKRLQRMHQARKAALRELQSVQTEVNGKNESEAQASFEYLLNCTDVWIRTQDPCELRTEESTGDQPPLINKKKPAGSKEDSATSFRASGSRLQVTPPYLWGELRPYQIQGVNWLVSLFEQGINGILADEMGLGKTFQTIALVSFLKYARGIAGPHLILCPKSVLGNWAREFKMWSPSMRVYRFHAAGDIRGSMVRAILNPTAMSYDVILTTYEMLNSEFNAFQRIRWRYLIVDEAHRLKSEDSVISHSVRKLQTSYRLLITGTPLQNNLRELWALLNFLIPDLFVDADSFDQWFNITEGKEDGGVMGRMYKLLSPLMLRRLKVDVNTSIPPKKEIYVECPLSALQREQYTAILAKDSEVLNKGSGQRSILMNIFMQLRKTCNHPFLFPGVEDGPPFVTTEKLITASGKLHLLDRILRHLYDRSNEHHKILIFSQMTRVLDILEDYCQFRRFHFGRIDGNTSSLDRDKQMAEFNAPNSNMFIFLLSTRAGGLGINLQAANYVVLYDSDWNPQADLQAQDRAHRMGQKRPVTVLRMITQGTVEERIYARALKKLYLDAVVVQQGRLQQKDDALSNQELLGMIKFGVEAMFRKKGGDSGTSTSTFTDEDIEVLLHRGEDAMKHLHAGVLENQQTTLANFKLGIDESNIYEFEGINYSEEIATKILFVEGIDESVLEADIREACEAISIGDLVTIVLNPNRSSALMHFRSIEAAKRVRGTLRCIGSCSDLHFSYGSQKVLINASDLVEHFEPQLGRGKRVVRGFEDRMEVDAPSTTPVIRLPKMPKKFDAPRWQLYNLARIHELQEKERAVLIARAQRDITPRGSTSNTTNTGTLAPPRTSDEMYTNLLTEADAKEKAQLLAEGFPSWTSRDFQRISDTLCMYGRHATDRVQAALSPAHSPEEVSQYLKALWRRGQQCLGDRTWGTLMRRIEKGEQAIQRNERMRSLIAWKVTQRLIPTQTSDVYSNTIVSKTRLPAAVLLQQRIQALEGGSWGLGAANYDMHIDALTMIFAHEICVRLESLERPLPDLQHLSQGVLRELKRAPQCQFDVFVRTMALDDILSRIRRLLRDTEKEMNAAQRGFTQKGQASGKKRSRFASSAPNEDQVESENHRGCQETQ